MATAAEDGLLTPTHPRRSPTLLTRRSQQHFGRPKKQSPLLSIRRTIQCRGHSYRTRDESCRLGLTLSDRFYTPTLIRPNNENGGRMGHVSQIELVAATSIAARRDRHDCGGLLRGVRQMKTFALFAATCAIALGAEAMKVATGPHSATDCRRTV